ncbi:MAG TPA: HAD family hydrolase [Blastocatellia bacterium]|nr:HAD family hydrolase [Blastocatellia bacterium]
MLIMDCDGVLTDGRIIFLPGGEETKLFDSKDGHGLRMAERAGIDAAIITGRASQAVRERARDLGLKHLYEKAIVKLEPYEKVLAAEGLTDEEICYVGDDVTDIPVMRRVGLAVAVGDAVPEAKEYAHLVTEHRGGRGAVREVIEVILKSQGKWDEAMERYLK